MSDWTTVLPNKSGWYWWRGFEGSAFQHPFFVTNEGDRWSVAVFDVMSRRSGTVSLEEFGGEWSSMPIAAPRD